MKTGSAVILGSAAVMAVLWATAAPRQPYPEPAAVPPIPKSEAERLADEVGAQTARLRAFLQSAPVPRTATRNPFQYAAVPAPPPKPEPVAPAPPPEPAAPPRSAGAPLRLIGVAEKETADGLERTAILTNGDQLFMVKVGDSVTDRYLVAAVGADAVALRDSSTGVTRRFALK